MDTARRDSFVDGTNFLEFLDKFTCNGEGPGSEIDWFWGGVVVGTISRTANGMSWEFTPVSPQPEPELIPDISIWDLMALGDEIKESSGGKQTREIVERFAESHGITARQSVDLAELTDRGGFAARLEQILGRKVEPTDEPEQAATTESAEPKEVNFINTWVTGGGVSRLVCPRLRYVHYHVEKKDYGDYAHLAIKSYGMNSEERVVIIIGDLQCCKSACDRDADQELAKLKEAPSEQAATDAEKDSESPEERSRNLACLEVAVKIERAVQFYNGDDLIRQIEPILVEWMRDLAKPEGGAVSDFRNL